MAKIVLNPNRCTGCRACEGACKQEHNHPVGVRWREVTSKTQGAYPKLQRKYSSNACKHCVKPKCLEACPLNAIVKVKENGLVKIIEEKCTGCKQCVEACPFGEMKFNIQTQKAGKCNYCEERISKGELPACVNTCMALALSWEE